MKKTTTALILTIFTQICSYCHSSAVSVDHIDYQFLVSNPHTDHVQHFEKLLQKAKIHSVLEFGLGYGTKYLLDHCEEVTSCEIILPDQTTGWFTSIQDLFQKYSNWTPVLKRGSRSMQNGNLLAYRDKKDPTLYDATYLLELKDICDELFKDKAYELAFVDPGFHMRGDLVNELFDRVSIIVAHDTNIAPRIYGWNKIHTPCNYEKIVFTEGQGVTFWIRHDRADLIAALGGRTCHIGQEGKKLRIFFPIMHHTLIESIARAFQHLGHTLVVPGNSFSPFSSAPGLKLKGTSYFEKNPLETSHFISLFSKNSPETCSFLTNNIEVIENDEMIAHPPDVLVANWLGVEKGIYNIYEYLLTHGHCKKNDVKIVHYSGNNSTVYNKRCVKNLISVDAFTAQLHNPEDTHIIFWIPWINFDALQYQGFSDQCLLGNYISHYYASAFKKSFSIFDNMTTHFKAEFPQLEIASPPFGPRDELLSYVDQSCATLHIKESEGFGYTIVESIAKGRPVFLKRSFSMGSRLMNWCIEGKTAFFFDEYEEFEAKLRRYLEDQEYRHAVQRECAVTARRLIDNEKQARILEKFLQNLK
jgi:hypothetical protein